MRERLGGIPFEIKNEKNRTVLRFYPKSSTAKNPDGMVFMLALDIEDKKKLSKIISWWKKRSFPSCQHQNHETC